MKCPFCGFAESKVIDSRPAEEGATIRRLASASPARNALRPMRSLRRSRSLSSSATAAARALTRASSSTVWCAPGDKRKVPLPVLEKIADEIEQELQSALEREITTEQVGEMVMKRLKDVDEVAYVRFASVYRQFKDIDTFMQELTKLLNDRG